MSEHAGSFHVTLNADVFVTNPGLFAGTGDPAMRLADLLTGLVNRYATDAGIRLVDSPSVQVEVAAQPAGSHDGSTPLERLRAQRQARLTDGGPKQ